LLKTCLDNGLEKDLDFGFRDFSHGAYRYSIAAVGA
jgi:hypothetical protein